MRTVEGKIVLPENAPAVKAKRVTIEVRDVSMADAPSTVVAEKQLDNVSLKPNGEIKFKLSVPEVEANRSLSLRVHVSLDGSDNVKSGDLLTTSNYSVPNTGTPDPLEAHLTVV